MKTHLPKITVPFYTPIPQVIEKISKAFKTRGDVLEVRGFPIRVFCFRNPEHCRQILTHKTVGETKMPALLPRVKWVMGKGAYIMAGGKAWRTKRHQVQAAFSAEKILDYCSVIPEIAGVTLTRLKKQEGAFDLYEEMQRLITAFSFKAFFSEDLKPEDLEAAYRQTHFVEKHFAVFMPHWIPFKKNLLFSIAAERIKKTMLKILRRRRVHPKATGDVLELLLTLRDEEGKPWTDDGIAGEMLSIYFGASVMATTLTWAISLLSQSPEVRLRLKQELDQVLQGKTPNSEDLKQLPYLKSVFEEVVRLYPPSWGYPRFCAEGMNVGGFQIPPKALLIPMVWDLHRHPGIWKNPSNFDPGRFAPEESQIPFSHLPFGAGPRACLGKNLAPPVIQLILAQMIQNDDIELESQELPIADFGFEIAPKGKILAKLNFLSKQDQQNPRHQHSKHEPTSPF